MPHVPTKSQIIQFIDHAHKFINHTYYILFKKKNEKYKKIKKKKELY